MINVIRMLTVDEGFKDTVYKDTKGKSTIGIGFNMDDVNAHTVWQYAGVPENFELARNGSIPISKESAWKLLNTCVETCKMDLKRVFYTFDTLPEHVKLALINLMYNMGAVVFSQFTGFIRYIKAGNYDAASDDLGNTQWATQVGKRRDRVMALLKEDDSGYN